MSNKLLIYQVFVRNYSKEGTFEEVRKDLPRIHALGVDILYLLPIHPIGVLARKGTYGSPYAIKDYFGIEKNLGTKEDFLRLVEDTHKQGMRIILDMVFHHTSPDNPLLQEHPEFYYYKDGKTGNRVGDWSDIIDLDTDREDTQEYLLSVLDDWKGLGVDGFRFDVASMIARNLFVKARERLGEDAIFFAESIDHDFAKYLKTTDHPAIPDEEMVPPFDYLYNYNYFRVYERQLKEGGHCAELAQAMMSDDGCKPEITRVHCLENHDLPRIARLIEDPKKLEEHIRLFFSLKGHMFLYAGQEYGNDHDVPLFEKDPVDFSRREEVLTKMYARYIQMAKSLPEIVSQRVEALDGNTLKLVTAFVNGETKEDIFHL